MIDTALPSVDTAGIHMPQKPERRFVTRPQGKAVKGMGISGVAHWQRYKNKSWPENVLRAKGPCNARLQREALNQVASMSEAALPHPSRNS